MFVRQGATFHVIDRVKKQLSEIWGSENRRQSMEHVCDSPKINVFVLKQDQTLRPFLLFKKDNQLNNVSRYTGNIVLIPQVD